MLWTYGPARKRGDKLSPSGKGGTLTERRLGRKKKGRTE